MTAKYHISLNILLSFLIFSLSARLHAGIPVWTFTPLTATSISVPANSTETIQYLVTNQSGKSHNLVMTPITGITQATTGAGICSNPFYLPSRGSSCTLSLQVNGSQLKHSITDGPIVCEQGSTLQCYKPSPSNMLNINVGAGEYTVGGTVTGLTGTVSFLNNGTDLTATSTDGNFTFSTPITEGNPYAVTVQTHPTDPTQTCTVVNGYGTMGGANVDDIEVTCSADFFTVGGTVTGLSGGTVTLLNDGTNSTPISTDGPFDFLTPIANGSEYQVTVATQPTNPTQTCTVANGYGTVSGDVENVTVTCATNTYTVGGTVSGLTAGGTVTLLNDGTNSTPISANGRFTFSAPIADTSPYAVTIKTQPATQTCTVANGTGTISGANVASVSVSCATVNTTLSVASTGTIPVNNGTRAFTVTNTGTNSAANIHAELPGGWTGVTQNKSGCTLLAPGATCNLVFSSNKPYEAQGNITITGDNISSPPKTAFAFTATGNNYLIWDVNATTSSGATVTTVQVIDTSDQAAVRWGANIIVNAFDRYNGSANTLAIYNTGMTPSAGRNCFISTNGGASLGNWYLPAICQMGAVGQGAGCDILVTKANIYTNLFQLGFGDLTANAAYWSSTVSNITIAWYFKFQPGQAQAGDYKSVALPIRCARALIIP